MCKNCESRPVYEFTNKRKLCSGCFVKYFQKKVFYTIRKFGMIQMEDIVGYVRDNDFRSVVLEDVLKMFEEKGHVELIKLHSQANGIKKTNNKITKIAVSDTTDSVTDKIVHEIIRGDIRKLDVKPVEGKVIRPLYLFLDKEVLLYAKLRKLRFKRSSHPTRKSTQNQGRQELREHCSPTLKTKNELSVFINELEMKHPEIKRAVVKGWMKRN